MGGGRGPGRQRTGTLSGVDEAAGRETDPAGIAKSIILQQLARGPRTRAQLKDRLRRRGVPDEVSDGVLDRFEDADLVDDAEFAKAWVEARRTGKGLARQALRYELRARGVAEDLIREAVDTLSADDELESARDLVRRRVATRQDGDEIRRNRRLAAMLARKGYGPEVARRAIVDVIGENADAHYQE